MRSLLLWCASNSWLAAHVPRWGFARRAVKRFLPGEGFDAALKAATEFKPQGVGAIFTLLGENITKLEEAGEVVQHYEQVLASSGAIQAEISVKPTQLGLDIDAAACIASLEHLAGVAEKTNAFMWVDMEGSGYTDRTIDLYRRLRTNHENVGLAMQAYLRRTAADVAGLFAVKPSVRLVKGAYAEPSAIAYTAKNDVDANYLALCVLMLPEVKRGNLRLVLGTHDTALFERVWGFAQALGVEKSQLENAMLYGIRFDEQLRLAKEGFKVRDLIAYGDAWYGWYLRRLAERPANMWFVARQLLP
ncbi:MAG TPA: proline dehydrogenase family protein [Candidatus Dormibacteraeota bacterium]|nr:proline dehydrogenase family protein [Candidatus Dormibacteraeota bacterium]